MRSLPRKALLAAICTIGMACDDAPQPPPELLEQARKTNDETPKKPTTQELLSGPRGVVSLGPLPLTVRAPSGWVVQTVGDAGAVVLLQGPTPSGEVQISLSRRPPAKPDQVEAVINGAKKELAATQTSARMAEARMLGASAARVLERQSVGRMMPSIPLDPEGKVMSKPSQAMSWTITVFVPEGGEFDAYELNFLGLTVDQYEADKSLLREVIDSLALAGPAPAGAQPAAATPAGATAPPPPR